jgi:CRP/FNR family cyclic AMP-dependent transcriptional regulator
MIRHGKKMSLAPGTVLIEQGKPTDCLYFVLHGTFEVYTPGTPRIALLKVGDVVGEISFVDSRPPTASVRAEVESKVGAIPRDLILERIREDTGFAARFYQALAIFLADRLRTYMVKVETQKPELDENIEDQDELAAHLFNNVSMAGTRFTEMRRGE